MALCSLPARADYGGSRGTYLKFELEKISIVSIEFHGLGAPVRSKVLRISGLPASIQTTERRTTKAPARRLRRKTGPISATLTGKRQHRPVALTKPVDSASPLIARALANNQILPRVVLIGRHRVTRQPVRITLQKVRIRSQRRQSRSSTGIQTEMVALDLVGTVAHP